MIKLEIKRHNMILTEKHQKYRHYDHVKLISMNILKAKNYCLLIKVEL